MNIEKSIKNSSIEAALAKLQNAIAFLLLTKGTPKELESAKSRYGMEDWTKRPNKIGTPGNGAGVNFFTPSWDEWVLFAQKRIEEPLNELRKHDKKGDVVRAVQPLIARVLDPAVPGSSDIWEQVQRWHTQRGRRDWMRSVQKIRRKAIALRFGEGGAVVA